MSPSTARRSSPSSAALGVDASTPVAAAQAVDDHHRRPWTQMLPPCLALREHRTAEVRVHVPDGDPVSVWIELETGGNRGQLRQLENWVPAREIDGGWVGEASFEIPADLPLGYHTLQARSGDQTGSDAVDHQPGMARVPRTDGQPTRLGTGDPALQRAVPAVLGRGGSQRSGGSGGLVGERTRSRLRPGQPDARRRTGAADGAVAVPAHQPQIREPALPADRADP